MRKFEVTITSTVSIEISDEILELHKDADWVNRFYKLDTPEKVAEHLAFNCGLHYRDVNQLDGFADRAAGDVVATVTWNEYETEEVKA